MKEYLKRMIDFWKKTWGKLVVFVICGSIVALFIASFCMNKSLTLSVMNEWVSLVVGMIALVLGVISLFLSFYNVEQSNEVQKETIEIMNSVREDITRKLNEIQMSMNDNFSELKHNSVFRGNEQKEKAITIVNEGIEWRKIDE